MHTCTAALSCCTAAWQVDPEQTGRMDYGALRRFLDEAGLQPTTTEMRHIMRELDPSRHVRQALEAGVIRQTASCSQQHSTRRSFVCLHFLLLMALPSSHGWGGVGIRRRCLCHELSTIAMHKVPCSRSRQLRAAAGRAM